MGVATDHGALGERLYAGLLERSEERLAALLGPTSTWELPGQSRLAGTHTGRDAILPVLRDLMRLGPIRPDAYDVAASEYHAVVMTRLVGDGLESDHAFVVVAGGEGRLDRAFHYVFDLYAFDAFFR